MNYKQAKQLPLRWSVISPWTSDSCMSFATATAAREAAKQLNREDAAALDRERRQFLEICAAVRVKACDHPHLWRYYVAEIESGEREGDAA